MPRVRTGLGRPAVLVVIVALTWIFTAGADFQKWTLNEAIQILTNSPWARQQTFTRVVGGIGSGVMGEKEIYSTFFVRILSAPPIRQAYARVSQLQHGYEEMDEEQKREFDRLLRSTLELDVSRWIVITVGFRSNDRNVEDRVNRFFQTQTVETLRNSVFLTTPSNGSIPLAAYYPPREEEVGAKFVFPRTLQGASAVSPQDPSMTFELDVPGANPQLRATFSVSDMVVNGELVL